jgi:transposase
MSETKRKYFTCNFKAKVALEAIRGLKTVNVVVNIFGVHPTQVTLWKKELTNQVSRGVIKSTGNLGVGA